MDDERDISFDGEGSYFGKQITLSYGSGVWVGDKDLSFEISYSYEKISVYRKDHEGYWVPEYLSVSSGKHPEYRMLADVLFPLLRKAFGV